MIHLGWNDTITSVKPLRDRREFRDRGATYRLNFIVPLFYRTAMAAMVFYQQSLGAISFDIFGNTYRKCVSYTSPAAVSPIHVCHVLSRIIRDACAREADMRLMCRNVHSIGAYNPTGKSNQRRLIEFVLKI